MKTKKLSTQPYKGTRDFYPEDMRLRNWIFNTMRTTAQSFGYEEYDGPMLELFEMYAAKSGEELVNEQLYHFQDRGGRHVAIRPEMTPTVSRMVAARINTIPRPIRWFSIPNLWRYERPQKGRLREHWQFNVDVFGVDSVLADLEIIEIAIQIMLDLGGDFTDFRIHISNRKLLNDFMTRALELDESGKQAVCKTIDKKDKLQNDEFRRMLSQTGLTRDKIDSLIDFTRLDRAGLARHEMIATSGAVELESLFGKLKESELDRFCTLDLSIVRGLDYYTGTVFEMYDLHPDNRRALFGGGRYDNLVALFSNQPLSGVGFGMGDVTIQDFMITHQLIPVLPPPVEVFVALFDETCLGEVRDCARRIRRAGFRVIAQIEPVKLTKQYKFAHQKNIPVVVLQGPDERAGNTISLKQMISGEQKTVPESELNAAIRAWLRRM